MMRHIRIGAVAGGTVGIAFALAIVSFADCAGPGCGRERVLGVALHAVLGILAGAVVGLVVGAVRRWAARAR